MQAQTTTTRQASSATVCAKADHLAVAYGGRSVFAVASGTRPGAVHRVDADPTDASGNTWACSCEWAAHGGRMCSHVRATVAYVERARARAARAAKRGA